MMKTNPKGKAKTTKKQKGLNPKLKDLDSKAKVSGGLKKTFNPQPDPPG
jgi:hypothetical protein